ncbi:hypothetical protein ACT17Q_14585 [Cellulomonas sp. CW35]|uniref:hypothetical protein n=1 Tax=Cellulomonas sp. CW35 TaxID=3458249 RepID=UPI0040341588
MARTERLQRFGSVAAFAVGSLAVGTLAGCTSDATALPSTADFVTLRISGDEVEPYAGFDDMLKSADLAASGVVGEPGPVRSVGERGSEAYVLPFEFTVSDVASGEGPSVVDVELSLGATDPEQAHAAKAAFSKVMSGQEAFLYLRAKQSAGDEGVYRIVNSYGLWMETADAALTAPLAADDPHGKPLWASDLKDVRSVRSLAADQSDTA